MIFGFWVLVRLLCLACATCATSTEAVCLTDNQRLISRTFRPVCRAGTRPLCHWAEGANERAIARECDRKSERERANVIAMRPKLTKQKPQQKQTMRTAPKFFKKFHVSCRSYSSTHASPLPLWVYATVCCICFCWATRDDATNTGKYLRRCCFFFFYSSSLLFNFFFF